MEIIEIRTKKNIRKAVTHLTVLKIYGDKDGIWFESTKDENNPSRDGQLLLLPNVVVQSLVNAIVDQARKSASETTENPSPSTKETGLATVFPDKTINYTTLGEELEKAE